MFYRVYDNVKERWIEKDIYLSPNGELFKLKHSVFGLIKLPLALSPERYTYHRCIYIQDKNNKEVYEGDYIKANVAEDKTVIGVVVYAEELSSYIILCEDNSKFYTLGKDVCEYIEIIGNVFDGYKEKTDDSIWDNN